MNNLIDVYSLLDFRLPPFYLSKFVIMEDQLDSHKT